MDFTGKVAIVTGGANGIGRAVCQDFVARGGKVAIVDRDEAAGAALAAELGAGRALFRAADVTRAADVQGYVQATLDAFGRIDAFHNNAGIEGKVQPIVEVDEAVFDAVMAVNVKGVFLGLKYVLPVMIRQGAGSVVNTASIAGLVGTPGMSAYVASKHAVNGITKVAAGEVGPLGIRVNAVCPGPIATRMVAEIARAGLAEQPGERGGRIFRRHPAAPLRPGGGSGEPRAVPALRPRLQHHRRAVHRRWRAHRRAGRRHGAIPGPVRGARAMADAEIQAIRALLAARPRPPELAERRRRLDALGTQFGLPDDIRIEGTSANGVTAEWGQAPGADAARVLLYLHGGGYVSGSLASHRHVVAEAGRQAGMRTLALDYRLAPEHPFPAAVEDAVAGYRTLLGQGIAPGHIAVGGDSAGGGLAVALLLALRDEALPLPACAWLVSPWVDLEGIGESMTALAAADPMVQKPYLDEIARAYLNGADPRDPLAAPLHGALRGLPPLLIQVGAAETLLDDAVRLAARAGAADVAVTLEVWPEMIHVWHLFHPALAAGRRALAGAGRFLREATARD